MRWRRAQVGLAGRLGSARRQQEMPRRFGLCLWAEGWAESLAPILRPTPMPTDRNARGNESSLRFVPLLPAGCVWQENGRRGTLSSSVPVEQRKSDLSTLAPSSRRGVGRGGTLLPRGPTRFMAAANFARPSSVSPPFFFGAFAALPLAAGAATVLLFAQRALAAAPILARASADIFRAPFFLAVGADAVAALPSRICRKCVSSFSICSLIWMASFN